MSTDLAIGSYGPFNLFLRGPDSIVLKRLDDSGVEVVCGVDELLKMLGDNWRAQRPSPALAPLIAAYMRIQRMRGEKP